MGKYRNTACNRNSTTLGSINDYCKYWKIGFTVIKRDSSKKSEQTGIHCFQHEEVLQIWVIYLKNLVDKRKEKYLISNGLRSPLSNLIEFVEENAYPDLYVIHRAPESGRGAPRTFICLRVCDESEIKTSSMNNKSEVK